MIKLTDKQRELISEGLINLGNIAAAALIFGQQVSLKSYDWLIFVYGIAVVFVCYFIGAFIIKPK